MNFKDIKQNYPVHIFDKQSLEYTKGKVLSVSLPRMQPTQNENSFNSGNHLSQLNNSMVVDVTIDAGGRSATYTIPENLSVAYAGNLVLSTENDGIIKEMEAMKNASEQALSQIDRQKEICEKLKTLLADLNPVYRERKNTEERFNKLEDSVSKIENILTNFINEFKK